MPPLLLGPQDGGLEEREVEVDGRGAVVIPRDGVGNEGGVGVGVHHAHGGDAHLGRVPDGQVRLKDVVESVEEDQEVRQADPLAVLDGGVGQQAALPVAGVSVLPARLGHVFHLVGRLAMAADEEDDAFAEGDVGREIEGQLEVLRRLFQVDDVVLQTAAEEIWHHVSAEETSSRSEAVPRPDKEANKDYRPKGSI